jgi:hypothetical protein
MRLLHYPSLLHDRCFHGHREIFFKDDRLQTEARACGFAHGFGTQRDARRFGTQRGLNGRAFIAFSFESRAIGR